MAESDFQSSLILELKDRFPGCVIMKTDPRYIQGIPDLLILYRKKWALLECKRSENEPQRPNQKYYVDQLDKLSFSRFIYPENKKEVLDELQQAFCPRRKARISGTK